MKAKVLDAIHLLLMLAPLLLLMSNLKYKSPRVALGMLLVFALVPHVWIIGGNCPLTKLSENSGGLMGTKTTSAFSEKYFASLYFPVFRVLGWKVTNQSMRIASSVHHVVYLIILCSLAWRY